MEFTREYQKWKNDTTDTLVSALRETGKDESKDIGVLHDAFADNIDRLWYESRLEVI